MSTLDTSQTSNLKKDPAWRAISVALTLMTQIPQNAIFVVNSQKERHTKRRNRLDQSRLNDLVFVKYNRALKRRYDVCDTIDPIYLNEIDESNEWLTGRLDDENDGDDELVFTEEDNLTWNVVATAAGVGELSYQFRARSFFVKGTSSSTNESIIR
ncbi:hypothetical protein Ddye_024816 [Dipteronia dyeriana]|uniref:HAT C-terminal dimerisation domain-containing protein n=1 Tax=Dipteronia dyeriana TaxID=168575 RepID=A0AAD9WUJ3_9ROSI|nr:hypothetical protein Ddye_024816 [Dipteronia dyeriana]